MAEDLRKKDMEYSELGFRGGSTAENHDPGEWGSELDSWGRSFRAETKTSSAAAKKKYPKRSSLDEDDFMNFLHGSDPVKIELNRFQNDVRGIIVAL
ncbi:hypothetical protein ACLOJK_022211 [Asimina triloba]